MSMDIKGSKLIAVGEQSSPTDLTLIGYLSDRSGRV